MKSVCSKHEQAYEVGDGCPYCQPDEPATVKEPPVGRRHYWDNGGLPWPAVPQHPSAQGQATVPGGGWPYWDRDDHCTYSRVVLDSWKLPSFAHAQRGETYEDWVRRCGIDPTVFGGRAVALRAQEPFRGMITAIDRDKGIIWYRNDSESQTVTSPAHWAFKVGDVIATSPASETWGSDQLSSAVDVVEYEEVPATPAGRLEALTEWLRAGYLTREQVLEVLDQPRLRVVADTECPPSSPLPAGWARALRWRGDDD